jgi:high-affinity Fe2+/Pb2+ permease
MTTSEQQPRAARGHLIRWIMVAVLVWGLFLAIGAVLFGGNLPLLRGLIIVGVVTAFLGFWLAALALRQRRLAQGKAADEERQP